MLSDEQIFRSYEDPKNKKFLEDLHEGVVPREIQSKYKQGLEVGLIDKKEEDYKEPPKPVQMFQGQGVQMGQQNVPVIKSTGVANEPKIDESKETGILQIKFTNGEKKQIKVNRDTQFKSVREYIQSLLVGQSFMIKKVFPQTDITQSQETIEELDLFDSTINVITK